MAMRLRGYVVRIDPAEEEASPLSALSSPTSAVPRYFARYNEGWRTRWAVETSDLETQNRRFAI